MCTKVLITHQHTCNGPVIKKREQENTNCNTAATVTNADGKLFGRH